MDRSVASRSPAAKVGPLVSSQAAVDKPLNDIAASLIADDEADQAVNPVTRHVDDAWLGGVCQALENRLGWPTWATRLIFLGLSLWLWLGVAIYAVLWLLIPAAEPPRAIGLISASRRGYRPVWRANRWQHVLIGGALVLYGIGAASLMVTLGRSWTPLDGLNWLIDDAFAVLGVLIGGAWIWRQRDQLPYLPSAGAGWVALGKSTGGFLIAAAAVVATGWVRFGPTVAWQWLMVAGVTLIVAVLMTAPWLFRQDTRVAGREAALIEQTKADMAAHLHDSVLQTLALIQHQAKDAKAVATLARRQERELRNWLYGDPIDEPSLAVLLKAEAAEIEDAHGVPVNVVTVGDAEMTPALDALVRAAREAMLNAAKHSGAPRVDVFSEVTDEQAEVFVRDRGRGFDPSTVAEDRMGLRGSILDRMHRYGGVVGLRSTVGHGTEVRLTMRRS
jgi:signal transduction histidine kinase/phage shock protein PspC (stress-responsive transcriptional regulator)